MKNVLLIFFLMTAACVNLLLALLKIDVPGGAAFNFASCLWCVLALALYLIRSV